MTDKLKNLIALGPDPTRGLRGLALARYHDIAQARRSRRRWGEIAEGLDLPASKAPAIAEAFRQVSRRIAEKKLEAPPADAAAASSSKQTAISAAAAKSEPAKHGGFKRIEVDKPLNTI